jgi:outer membrane lipoprotein-sorting protein
LGREKEAMSKVRKLFFLLIVGLSTVSLYAAELGPKNIDVVLGDLQEKMSKVLTLQTDFSQEKNLALFKQKLILKGKIFIQKPAMLSWRVFSPMVYSLVINGSTISQWDEDTNQVQQMSLANNPSFQAAIEQMQNWFFGVDKAMQDNYEISLRSQYPLSLEFTPKGNSVTRNFIKRVIVSFQEDQQYIKEIDVQEVNGDSTLLKFINPKLNQPISAKAWEVKADVR